MARADAGRLIVKRDSGFMAGGCTFRLYANGEALADFRPGEVATFYVEPGELVIGAQARGFCGSGDSETGITLKPGQTKTLRISVDNGAAVRIAPTAF